MDRDFREILQIIPAPANMYIQYHDKERPKFNCFQQVACLALVQHGYYEHGTRHEGARCVEAMVIQNGSGNWIDIDDNSDVYGLVMTDTPPSPILTGQEEDD